MEQNTINLLPRLNIDPFFPVGINTCLRRSFNIRDNSPWFDSEQPNANHILIIVQDSFSQIDPTNEFQDLSKIYKLVLFLGVKAGITYLCFDSEVAQL